MTRESHDPVLAALSELAPPAPRDAHDTVVRARCHAAMAAPAHRPPRPFARGVWQAIDRLLPVAALVYAVAVVVEGLKVMGVL